MFAWPDALFTYAPLHVVAVHFPVACFVISGILSAWILARRADAWVPLVRALLYIGTLGSAISLASGLYLEETLPHSHEAAIGWVMEWHERAGIAVLCLAVLLSAAAWLSKLSLRAGWIRFILLGNLLLMALVAITGHLGGILVHQFGVGLPQLDLGLPHLH